MSTCNQLDLQTLGSQPISMSKNLSITEMNRLSLRNNRLKFKTTGKLPIILEEFIEYTPI